jgi:hypothetical protein
MMDGIVFWGVCLVLVLLPLPFWAMDEWAVFTFEAATFVLFVLHVVGAGRAEDNEERTGAPGRSTFPSWLKTLSVLSLGVGVFQLVPIPPSILSAISPRTALIWSGAATEGIGGAASAKGGWATLSLVPNFTLHELIRYVFYFLFAYLVYKHISTRKRLQVFIILLFAVACFQAIFCLAEFFGGTHRVFGFQSEAYVDSALGNHIKHNYLAGFMEMIFPISVGYFLARVSLFAMNRGGSFKERFLWFRRERSQKAVVLGIVPVLIGMGIFFAQSRTGIFILFASILLMVIALTAVDRRKPVVSGGPRGTRGGRARKRYAKIIWTVSLVVAFVIILIGIRPVIKRSYFAALAQDVRPAIFRNTAEIIKDFPIVGTGMGTYLYVYPMYEKKHSGAMLEHAYNDYLEVLAEGGIVGGGLVIVVAFGALIWLFAGWARRSDYLVRGVGLGCLVGIVSILIHGLTDFNLHISVNAVMFVTLYALAARLVGLNSSQAVR